jgi:hypothetical protein
MCEALGTSKQYLTVEMRLLCTWRHVDYRIARIRGGNRRKRAYALTPEGERALKAVEGKDA